MTANSRITLVVSDFHMGGGIVDPGDDFVYREAAFERFLDEQLRSAAGQTGGLELILNGDTFELAQVRPEVYTLGSSDYWCSKDESLQKLEYVLAGHEEIFDGLARFVAAGNLVTMMAGNHDVDLYWPEVQARLERRIGAVTFQLGEEWYTRYGGQLAIAHGHMLDPANRFAHWNQPILPRPDGDRLEMCPGTLFMVKVVNLLERDYPFADNLHPVTALADILGKDQLRRLGPVSWMLAHFAARHLPSVMGIERTADSEEAKLRRALLGDSTRFRELAQNYRAVVDSKVTDEELRARLTASTGLVEVMLALLAALPIDQWLALARTAPSILSSDRRAPAGTLSVVRSGRQQADEVLREAAKTRLRAGASVVVMGHTHQPDYVDTPEGVYFNTGSWTRYVNADKIGLLTLEDLKTERDFPYQLNYVRVEADTSHRLSARMIAFKEETGFRYGQRLNLSGV